ncbi:3-hydroxyacyl-CoA dehydrogenase NAD-binding domain-containing protein [Paenibacillus sp. N3/727]|uniref:3-hydroxyacyl-CoA dehydrogenase/enoyl-CoA hydratase family protein n=1 Tax=Paenibacillus sp. N3/727 TaxID=2925845 RepID=UPI001F53089B|nr:3-hydroxyacyl-CoA dehydrogenase/enoyl-CoA hydratase family protein [Paenibacillus sp. N3/727]UNK18708.1 3-hydroxyacyl-CoA dehydrogenase NAD-binding domain-containing protein [Paenibacillus sp. N3/727]
MSNIITKEAINGSGATSRTISKAAVIGSGVMGSGIAAHLANAGIPCLLLDMVPKSLTPEEEKAGLTLDDPKVRNRLAAKAVAGLPKASTAPLYSPDFANRITPGNTEDHLNLLKEVDWIIEVVTERLEIKKSILSLIEGVRKEGAIVSTNTSGISVNEMAEDCSEEFRRHFLGTHFFNPPRHMKLLEIIPGFDTDPEITAFMTEFCEKRLGKGVVLAKDTPNFISNRIGTYGLLVTLKEMIENGYTVEEVDAATGPVLGRPKSATFRTLDLVGIDTFVHVARNVYDSVPDGAEKNVFTVPEVMNELVTRGWTGEKGGQGFYKKMKGEQGSKILSLNLSTMEYNPGAKISSASLEAAKAAKGSRKKIKAFLGTPDRYSELAWNVMKQVLVYSAEKLGEIADSIEDIDNAMKWGFNWELGPFETWDLIGLSKSVQRMEAEGLTVPTWVKDWIAAGNESFYQQKDGGLFHYFKGEYKGTWEKPEMTSLQALKSQNRIIRSNTGANLIDIGDGVACLEFTSPNNAIGADILVMIQQSVDEVRANYRGLVVANEGRNFCVGANLMLMLMEAQSGDWDEVDDIIRLFQGSMMKLKGLEKPVVAAPHRMTLGGGVEACLPADRVVFSSETYFGLVETGVGLIPAGGGCKEMALRISDSQPDPESDLQPAINKIFETIAMAKTSTSGHDAIRMGYGRPTDTVVMNPDHRIYEAKQAVLAMDRAGYVPPQPGRARVVGRDGRAVLQMGALGLKQSGYISEHDHLIAKKLAHILSGGDVPAGTVVTEQHLLDLEREAFLSLLGEVKTQQRMQHMLAKGKPLRN